MEVVVGICLLCQREGKLSREHALPSWVGRELNTTGTAVGHRYEGPPGAGILREWEASGVDIKVKVVCEPCNNGPLSALEQAAGPVLIPLLYGRSRLLIRRECTLIARWFIKTMLMLELAGHPDYRVAMAEHEQWVRDEVLPMHVTLWLGTARRPSGTATAGRALDIRVGERGGSGWFFTIIMGHLVLVAMAGPSDVGEFTLTGPLAKALTRIWPKPPLTARYPPEAKLGRRQVPLILHLVHQSIPSIRPKHLR